MKSVASFFSEFKFDDRHAIGELHGPVTPEENAAREREEREELERRRVDESRWLFGIGVPAKDIGAIVSGGLHDTVALASVREFLADSDARILVLSGSRGTGKTTAAGYAASQSINDRHPAGEADVDWRGFRPTHARDPFRPGPNVFMDVSKLARVSKYDDAEMASLERAALLVIDDLGAEYNDKSGAFRSTLDGLVNARYANSLRTVITTNLPAAEFKSRYGERISDRVREVGKFIELRGESLRKKNGK